jgi:ATP/maltotriose-dependent transcriptional regulator MalT
LARAFQAELALRQGRLAEASAWAEQFVAQPFVPMYRFYVPQLTMARVLLAQGTTSSRAQAADLLPRLVKQDARVDYVGQILAPFRQDERALAQRESDPQTAHLQTLRAVRADPFLMERELEILALLEQPLRNNEIADKLFVSRETVKSHLKNLYRKLNAGNRLEAVAKARALGVLLQR